MIPVIAEASKFKFLKKGKGLNHELCNLFAFLTNNKKEAFLQEWSPDIVNALSEAEG